MKVAIMASFSAKRNMDVNTCHGCKHREKVKAKAEDKAEENVNVMLQLSGY